MSASEPRIDPSRHAERVARLRTRRDFHQAQGVLLVTREPPSPVPPSPGQPPTVPPDPADGIEILLSVWDDGHAIALHGHVDLGTGIRTALAQIVAEELELPATRVSMVLGDTGRAPNQGPTIASQSIQIHAGPLRLAAAQARAFLVGRAAERLGVPAAALIVADGVVRARAAGSDPSSGAATRDPPLPAAAVSYAELLADQHIELLLDPDAPVKSPADYGVVGRSEPRVDIPAKAFGEGVFVHDLRLPGMLHGRVVRPPYAGADHGDFIGNTLESVDKDSIAHIPGVRAVVVVRDFIGVVAEREEQAERAAAELRVRWKPWPGLADVADAGQAIRANPATPRRVVDEGDVDAALADAAQWMQRSYTWPYQMHASIGPSCAVAHWHDESGPVVLTVHAGTQNPHVLRRDLAMLMGVPDVAVDVVRLEAAGCYGRNGADDVAADAALLARAVGAPVRVQLTRAQENLWEPKGAAQLMDVRGGLTSTNAIAGYDFTTSYPSNGAPTLALLLTRTIEPVAQAFEMGDRTARPPYEIADLRVTVNDMAPILRASWLRGVSALPNSFAHESFVDELASAAREDPVAFRLRHLKDRRANELLRATAERAGWRARTEPQQGGASGDWRHGQGVAYARYVHSKWPGFGAAWSAWVADVDVNQTTGEVHVSRVVVGHDAGMIVNPAGVDHQVHGNVLQTTSRALKEQLRTDPATNVAAAREWGSYPILSFREVPVIEVMHMPRQDMPPMGVGESASVPGTAAIANAIFDATGVRFRQPPFTPEKVRAALNPLPAAGLATTAALGGGGGDVRAGNDGASGDPAQRAPRNPHWPQPKKWWLRAGALAAGVVGIGTAMLGLRPAIAPIARADTGIYTAATIERGRLLAAAGNCATCHTEAGGLRYAGGRAFHTPFGTVYATNLTPDVDTGIGAWSFSAFQRAMREGVSRDGRHLYPVFPYTAFTRMSDDDLTALYAFLMSQPAVRAATAPARMAFPFGARPLLGLWNAMFHAPGAMPDAGAAPGATAPARSARWQRGAYLVEAVGHCGACHTPRSVLGAERSGSAHLSGAVVDGWEAPAITSATRAPVPWTEAELFAYLRGGHSAHHGAAAGPMAAVVRELSALPDGELRAMATYLASFNPDTTEVAAARLARDTVATAAARAPVLLGAGQRLFDSACAACHHDGDGPRVLGVNVPLALNTNVHADSPDNLIRVILEGVQETPSRDVGFMAGFADALDDAQVVELVEYLRARFAPGRAAWGDLANRVRAVRTLLARSMP